MKATHTFRAEHITAGYDSKTILHDVSIICLLITLASVQITGATFFQAIGKPIQALILGLTRQFLALIPLFLIIPPYFGIEGVWWCYPAAAVFQELIALVTDTVFIEVFNTCLIIAAQCNEVEVMEEGCFVSILRINSAHNVAIEIHKTKRCSF